MKNLVATALLLNFARFLIGYAYFPEIEWEVWEVIYFDNAKSHLA